MIEVAEPSFLLSAVTIFFNPLFWNIAGRQEYQHRILTKLFGKSERACYFIAAVIFTLGLVRDYLYKEAVIGQKRLFDVTPLPLVAIGCLLISIGSVLVISSMYKLGIVGTYLGDYFGILKDEMISSFPFNVCNHPMYVGSALSFFGVALYYSSPAGLFLSSLVALAYYVASIFEYEFTSMIYKSANSQKRKSG